uniref:NADH-ubiquinone oxidoreductase chain 6 n=1 Tax=Cucujoidea sp. 2 KM-2017 TaxID=2219356 RepID=A0A346RJJ1_9CUCU|nr:NADH dehydrogenase subunit 6 [Cucujoidea sp. 2 KM-2017]
MMSLFLIMTSLLFIFMDHPLSYGLILLIQTIFISLNTGSLSLNYWFSYIIFLIMIGGMLILFLYMTSVASNEKFKYSSKTLSILIMFFMLIIMLMILDQYLLNLKNFNILMLTPMTYSYENMFNKYMNLPNNLIITMMIIYLFITLIAIVKITNVNYGPLRQKF